MYRVEVSKVVRPSWFFIPTNALGRGGGVVQIGSSLGVPDSRITLRGSMQLFGEYVQFLENVRRLLDPALVIGVPYRDVVGNHYNLFNFPKADDVVY